MVLWGFFKVVFRSCWTEPSPIDLQDIPSRYQLSSLGSRGYTVQNPLTALKLGWLQRFPVHFHSLRYLKLLGAFSSPAGCCIRRLPFIRLLWSRNKPKPLLILSLSLPWCFTLGMSYSPVVSHIALITFKPQVSDGRVFKAFPVAD